MNQPSPVNPANRIVILDSLRGIAISGVLLVNIFAFGLPYPSVTNPAVTDDLSGIDYYVWFVNEWLVEGNFRSLLSMLFGAGMLLFLERIQASTNRSIASGLFLRRQFWLLIFGLVNIYLFLWFWDILSMYAVCGMILFAFRKVSVKKLFVAAILCLLITDTLDTVKLYRKKLAIHKGELIIHSNPRSDRLFTGQQDDLEAYTSLVTAAKLESKQKTAKENVEKTLGTLSELHTLHRQQVTEMQISFFTFHVWDILLFMFIGMAFYKLEILSGKYSFFFYAVLAIAGMGIGLFLSWLRLRPMIANHFDEYAIIKNARLSFYETARSFRAIGFFGLVMLLYKIGKFSFLWRWLQPVGQMAFTNYLLQSILAGLFFYGIGFSMFGKLGRAELYFVVLAIWLFQFYFCHTWMRYFYYGPFEWIWRSLTYWEKQPFKKK